MADTTPLAPCPFCGAPAHGYAIEPHSHSPSLMRLIPGLPDHPGSYVIEGQCACGSGLIGEDETEVVARWNRRATQPAHSGEPVALTLANHEAGEIGYCQFTSPVPFETPLYAAPKPVEREPAQWQRHHQLRTNGEWKNTDEHDAKWWRDNSQGWEIRALYTTPQPTQAQAEPKSGAKSFQTYGEANAYSKGYYAGKKAATQAQAQAGAVPLTDEQIKTLMQAHRTAMLMTCKARVPECGEFAAIAQDLDWLCESLAIKGDPHGTDN